jgi:probable F420-dependent oxidoreductase
MRFACAIPQFYGSGEFDPEEFRRYLARAEELGFHGAWTQEAMLGPSSQLAPIEAMTFAAACTTRLRLGCVVLVSTLYSPVHLAKSLGTLDQLSQGRLEIGVGTGGPARPFAAYGVDPARYVARFSEGLALMKALWTEPSVTFEGEFWQLTDAVMAPRPLQRPYPPLWIGASGPAALRRAARQADGFFGAGSSTTAAFVSQVRTVRQALAEAGRSAGEFGFAKRVYIAVDSDSGRARRQVDDGLARLYGPGRGTAVADAAIAGTAAECVRLLREVIDAGAELILFTPLHDQGEQNEILAAEVIPQLG